MKPIPQGPFIRGINAAAQVLAQPKGSLPRVSNLIYTHRGSLATIDGSRILNWFNSTIQSNRGRFMAIQLFQPTNVARYFLALEKALDQNLTVPVGLVAADGGAGGTLGAGTYFYVVTAIDGVGGETPASVEANVAIAANHKVSLTWTAVTNATGYNVYRGTSTGNDFLMFAAGLPVTTNSFTDDGSATVGVLYNLLASPNGAFTTYRIVGGHVGQETDFTTTGPNALNLGNVFTVAGCSPAGFNAGWGPITRVFGNTVVVGSTFLSSPGSQTGGGGTLTVGNAVRPPTINTTQQTALIKMPNQGTAPIAYSNSNIVTLFPADLPIGGGDPGGSGGGGGTGGGGSVGGPPPTIAGGVLGNVTALPQMLQFQNSVVIALGNGFAPQVFIDPSTVTAITSTFVPAFPTWSATTAFGAGSIIQPTTNTNNIFYKALQGGTSGASQPAVFSTQTAADKGKQVADAGIIWVNQGATNSAAPAPPGAAHIIEYAGSLWVANTSFANTANGLDGPSVVRMSDVNNINSWNPINAAFLDKDDGTSIQGMAAFTITAQGIPPQGSLVVFKDFASYQIAGVFGSPNFAIQRVKTDMGCIAPRSIQFLPGFGVARLTHLGIAVFDGVEDRVVSEEIRPYLFPSSDSIGPSFPPVTFSSNLTNQNPLNPALWSRYPLPPPASGPLPPLQITNSLIIPTVNTGDCGQIYTGVAFPADQFAEITIGQLAVDGECGPTVRVTQTGGYAVSVLGPPSAALISLLIADFVHASNELGTFNAVINPGDVVRLSVAGTALTVTLNGVKIITANDSSQTSGSPGLFINTFNVLAATTVTNFSAGATSTGVSDITVMDANFAALSWGSQTANPPMYVLAIPIGNSQGLLTRLLAYDLVLRAWSVVDLPFPIGTMTQMRAAGTAPVTVFGGAVDGTLQRWQAGDVGWYSNSSSISPVAWSFQTPEAFLQAADQRLYCRNLVVRGINTNSLSPITVTTAVGGTSLGSATPKSLPTTGDFDIFVPIGATGLRFHATVAGNGNVEIQALDWHVEEKPLRVPVTVA
jgi:hypothetical protein